MTEQRWSPTAYAEAAGFVSALGNDVVTWLAPQPGERILDLGCGDGTLMQAIAATGADVRGVDASSEMVGACRAKGLQADPGRGEALRFDREFDAVFSNAALHWMKNAPSVISGVARALRPGGRFVAEFGGFGNVAAIRAAMIAVARARGRNPAPADPWYFPTAEEYSDLLTAGGFAVDRILLFARPTPLPESGIRGWLSLFRAPFIDQFAPGSDRESVLADIEAALAPLRLRNGTWVADYVRLRFSARLKTGPVG
ncbi:MAG: class I SAM-dependent methyltransferase [Bauldia sp.]